MAHPLAFNWTSKLINDTNGQAFDDIEGLVIDLRQIDEGTGSVSNCTQGGKRILGKATPLTGQEPLRFRVLFRHEDGSRHRGFAVENSAGEIMKIVGALVLQPFAARLESADVKALADQTEATWVATKGG